MKAGLTRREFIHLTGLAGGGLVLSVSIGGCTRSTEGGTASDVDSESGPATNRLHAFVELDADDHVTVMISKSEMGQGVTTALAMIVAEELGARWDQVRIRRADLDEERYGAQATGGSSTVRLMWLPLRRAGAAVRTVLEAAAAERWGVDVGRCEARGGFVYLRGTKRRHRFGELAAEAAELPLPDPIPLRDAGDVRFRLVGHPQRAAETDRLVTGRARFGMDVRVPDMRFAAVIRPPRQGAVLSSFDPAEALRLPGVEAVVEVPAAGSASEPDHVRPGVAVVARDTWTALTARRAVRVVWEEEAAGTDDTEALRRELVARTRWPGDMVTERGTPNGILASAAPGEVIDATYEQAFLYHAQMEPMNCTAKVEDGRCEIWSPTQFPDWAARGIAEALGLALESVTVHVTRMGGGFGRRINPDFSIEAALVSRAFGGPVQVVWSREDDLRHGFYRPMMAHRLEAVLDGRGRPRAIRHRAAGSPRGATAGISYIPYRCPHHKSESADLPTSFPWGWWRSVVHSHTAFAIESFMDELAEAAGRDPLEYRLELIDGSSPMPLRELEAQGEEHEFDPARLRGVLELVRGRSGWGSPPPADRARGVASHWCMATYVAEVVEVRWLESPEEYVIERITAAVDCGIVVNPDGARGQVEGGIIDALSAARHQQVTATEGRVDQENFGEYRVTRMKEAPRRIDVHFVPSRRPPSGLGEPAVPPAAAALANALYAATGRRWRRQPFDTFGPERP